MKLRKTRKAHIALAIGIVGAATLVIVGPGSTAAMAGRLIGSAAIKNNAVRSIDLRNGTVQGVDVRDGSLTAADFSGTMRGATGPAGKPGPPGPAGSGGGRGPDSIVAWDVHHDPGPSNPSSVVLTSTDFVPAGTQIEALKLSVDDFASCTYGSLSIVAGAGQILGSTSWTGSSQTWTLADLPGGGVITVDSTPLTLNASCTAFMAGQPVPAFDASVTFAFTARSSTPTATFN